MSSSGILTQAGGLLHGKKVWPLSVLRFLVKNNYKLAFAVHCIWFSCTLTVFRVYWRCTRNNLSLPEHFCISLFLKVWQNRS